MMTSIYRDAPSTCGSVLLVAISVVTILVAVAYGYLAAVRKTSDGIQALHFSDYSRLAARAGMAHACAVLDQEFLATPGKPTSFNRALQFRRGFMPIDSYTEGLATVTLADDEPLGLEFGAFDSNENDVKIENGLLESYTTQTRDEKTEALAFAYRGRGEPFLRGTVSHPGGARWIEPGYFHRDLLANPVSFAPGYIAPPASVNVDQPLYLDDRLRPVAVFGSGVRYRLRYAIAIEDLSSRLLNGVAQRVNSAAGSVFTASPVPAAGFQAATETDPVLSLKYASSFVNQREAADSKPFLAWNSFQGLGQYPESAIPAVSWGGAGATGAQVVTKSVAGSPVLPVDLPAVPPAGPILRYTAYGAPANAVLAVANRGPWFSFESFAWPFQKINGEQEAAFVYTPFGSRGDSSVAASRWNYRYPEVDTPWRVNLLTAPPQVVFAMLYAYMPLETWTYNVNSPSYTLPLPAPPGTPYNIPSVSSSGVISATNLFNDVPEFTGLFSHVASNFDPLQLYPGVVRSGSAGFEGGAQPCWLRRIGKHVTVNEFSEPITADAAPAPARNDLGTIYSPLRGQVGGFYKKPAQATNPATGQTWSGTITSLNQNGFYNDSYYHDLYAALGHAIAVAQFAWMGDTGDPANSATKYPLSWNDPMHPGLAGQPTIDSVTGTCLEFNTVKKVDEQFVKNLGEDPRHYPHGSRPSSPMRGLFIDKPAPGGLTLYRRVARLVTYLPTYNIKQIRDSVGLVKEDYDPPALTAADVPPAKLVQVTNLMELVLNDMRLSFFGANPQYADFRPIDFNDDGKAYCSGYTTGFGVGSPPPAVDRRFSLTGYFVMQKSRYYRIFCRGELFDVLRNCSVSRTDSELVYALDPEGALFDLNDQPIAGSPAMRTQTLYQRWLPDRYRGTQSLADPR
jgi:hypothetical protein